MTPPSHIQLASDIMRGGGPVAAPLAVLTACLHGIGLPFTNFPNRQFIYWPLTVGISASLILAIVITTKIALSYRYNSVGKSEANSEQPAHPRASGVFRRAPLR